MSSRVHVHLGRDGPKSVELDEPTVEVSDDFTVVIENHGPPQHVHLSPAADLARFVTVDESNRFIDGDEIQAVHVAVDDDRPQKFDGQLRVVTGYGTEESTLAVALRQPGSTQGVTVDASLGEVRDDPPEPPTVTEVIIGPGTAPLVALATVALLLAVGAILVATEVAVVLGAIAVLVGVGVAILLLVR